MYHLVDTRPACREVLNRQRPVFETLDQVLVDQRDVSLRLDCFRGKDTVRLATDTERRERSSAADVPDEVSPVGIEPQHRLCQRVPSLAVGHTSAARLPEALVVGELVIDQEVLEEVAECRWPQRGVDVTGVALLGAVSVLDVCEDVVLVGPDGQRPRQQVAVRPVAVLDQWWHTLDGRAFGR